MDQSVPEPQFQTADAEPGDTAKILVVDDDPANLIAMREMLADLGQPVLCASSGRDALRLLLKEDFAVILLDVRMPGMDGYETAAMIRAREKSLHIPVIFLSAVDKEPSHLFRGYAAGAVDYVFKPVEPMILKSKVSVFVELHKKAEEIKRQAEQERKLLAENYRVRLEQVNTARKLRRSQAQQSLVISSLPIALYVSAAGDDFRSRSFVGGNIEDICGLSRRQVADLRSNWLSWVHPDDRGRIMDLLAGVPASGVFSAEYRLMAGDGSYRWFSDRGIVMMGHRNKGKEMSGILLDISERRALEEQLAHARKMEAIGQMTGGIAHDFNNMLTVIIGSLDRAIPAVGDEPALKRRLDLAMQAARSCGDMTKRLLGFARRQSLEPKVLNLGEEMKRLDSLFKRLVGPSISLRIDCDPDAWPAYLDGSHLEAAVVNLIINARDATPADGEIVVAVGNRPTSDPRLVGLDLAPGNYVELSVTDNGTGMSEEVRERAFEPFYTTKETGKGTGLGLSSIYGFVRQSGGSVTIESEPGNGTSVRLFFPRTWAAPEGADTGTGPGTPDLKGLTVLLVEDEVTVREVAQAMLADLGCEVAVAHNGDQALDIITNGGTFGLLFTDCMLPGNLDGPSLAHEAIRVCPELPVLLTSGQSFSQERIANLRASFLGKPYTVSQLKEAIGRLLPE